MQCEESHSSSLTGSSVNDRHNFSERLFGDNRDAAICGRIADGDKDKGPLVRWAIENFGEKAHGAGCVGQRREAGLMQACQQKTNRDTDRLLYIIVLDLARAA